MKKQIYWQAVVVFISTTISVSSMTLKLKTNGYEWVDNKLVSTKQYLVPNEPDNKNFKSINKSYKTYSDLAKNPNPYPAEPIPEPMIIKFLEVINDARSKPQDCGKFDERGVLVLDDKGRPIYDGSGIIPSAPPVSWSHSLYRAAYEHNIDMIDAKYVAHQGSGTEHDWTGMDLGGIKSHFMERAANNGYLSSTNSLGENISVGLYTDTIEKAVGSWLASPYHCKVLMGYDFREVGVSHIYRNDGRFHNYWTLLIGGYDIENNSNLIEIEGTIEEGGLEPHYYLFIQEKYNGTMYRISNPESYNLHDKLLKTFKIKAQIIDPNPNRWPFGAIIKVLEAKEIIEVGDTSAGKISHELSLPNDKEATYIIK